MRKNFAKILLIAMMISILVGCGSADKSETIDIADAAENTLGESETKVTEIEEESKTPDNAVALGTYEEEGKNASVEIVFNTDKLKISDEDSGSVAYLDLELIGDVASVLEMSCEWATVQELYDETMEGYSGDGWVLSGMTESTIAGMPVYYFDVHHESIGSKDYYFIIDVGNGLCLYNGSSNGYNGKESFENMMSYAFVELKQGDGSLYRPELPFTVKEDGSVLTIQFESGESYTLDYSEDIIEVSMSNGSRVYSSFVDETMNEYASINMFISNKYASIEEYDKGEEESGYWGSGLSVTEENINGVDVQYIYNKDREESIFFIPMKDGYALRGRYRYRSNDGTNKVSVEEALAMMLGGDVEAVAQNAAVDYGYQAPDALGSDVQSLNFKLDGELYRFPVPAYVFIENGWKIPDIFLELDSEIPAGDTVEAAFENGEGSVIYDVVLSNPTDKPIAIQDGLVVEMIIAEDSNVDLEFPTSITIKSPKEQISLSTYFEPAENGDYIVYLWFREEDSGTIEVWIGSDGNIEFFRFAAY